MRILSITAGAARMLCGSCLRDNALAAELMRQGHEVTLLPLYTPTRTDEENVSVDRVFFGGISIYLQQHSALFRYTPRFLDRVWDSNFALRLAARQSIPTNPRLLGELTLSTLRGERGFQKKEIAKLIGWLKTQPRPDVINLPYTLLISLARPLKQALGAPVCCALQGEDLYLEGLEENYRKRAIELIRGCVPDVDAFLAVSEYYADFMTEYLGIPREKIRVVPLGINLNGYPEGQRAARDTGTPFRIGYFARVAPEKGLHLLCDAYRLLRREMGFPAARLDVAGYVLAEHKAYVEEQGRKMNEWGLGAEFQYHGVLDREEKIRFLSEADVLAVPSVYAEPKGIYLLEAMACGTPVIVPRRGAFTEILERTRGGLLVAPDSPAAVAEGILAVRNDPQLRRRLGEAGAEAVRRHYGVSAMAARAVEVFMEVTGHKREPVPVA